MGGYLTLEAGELVERLAAYNLLQAVLARVCQSQSRKSVRNCRLSKHGGRVSTRTYDHLEQRRQLRREVALPYCAERNVCTQHELGAGPVQIIFYAGDVRREEVDAFDPIEGQEFHVARRTHVDENPPRSLGDQEGLGDLPAGEVRYPLGPVQDFVVRSLPTGRHRAAVEPLPKVPEVGLLETQVAIWIGQDFVDAQLRSAGSHRGTLPHQVGYRQGPLRVEPGRSRDAWKRTGTTDHHQ